MATKEYYIGTHGPYFYDDADVPEGFPTPTRPAVIDDGVPVAGRVPVEVVTDVTLTINFTAETFNLVVTKQTI